MVVRFFSEVISKGKAASNQTEMSEGRSMPSDRQRSAIRILNVSENERTEGVSINVILIEFSERSNLGQPLVVLTWLHFVRNVFLSWKFA